MTDTTGVLFLLKTRLMKKQDNYIKLAILILRYNGVSELTINQVLQEAGFHHISKEKIINNNKKK